MVKNTRLITINNQVISHRKGKIECRQCSMLLVAGDQAVAHGTTQRRKAKIRYYCITCADRLGIFWVTNEN